MSPSNAIQRALHAWTCLRGRIGRVCQMLGLMQNERRNINTVRVCLSNPGARVSHYFFLRSLQSPIDAEACRCRQGTSDLSIRLTGIVARGRAPYKQALPL